MNTYYIYIKPTNTLVTTIEAPSIRSAAVREYTDNDEYFARTKPIPKVKPLYPAPANCLYNRAVPKLV